MSNKEKRALAKKSELEAVEGPPGILRTTMAYDADTMLCHIVMKPGAVIPLHDHPAVQNGYVLSGKVKFNKADGSSFIAEEGTGYVFGSMEAHGAEVIETAVIIECFAPMRPEYADN